VVFTVIVANNVGTHYAIQLLFNVKQKSKKNFNYLIKTKQINKGKYFNKYSIFKKYFLVFSHKNVAKLKLLYFPAVLKVKYIIFIFLIGGLTDNTNKIFDTNSKR